MADEDRIAFLVLKRALRILQNAALSDNALLAKLLDEVDWWCACAFNSEEAQLEQAIREFEKREAMTVWSGSSSLVACSQAIERAICWVRPQVKASTQFDYDKVLQSAGRMASTYVDLDWAAFWKEVRQMQSIADDFAPLLGRYVLDGKEIVVER